jgi:hypothetical protein
MDLGDNISIEKFNKLPTTALHNYLHTPSIISTNNTGMRLICTLVGTFFHFPILPLQRMSYYTICHRPWPHLAHTAPWPLAPGCWELAAAALDRGRPPRPWQEFAPPAPDGGFPRQPLAELARSCLEPARTALAEFGRAGPWQRSLVPPWMELARASPAWSLPVPASVGAPSPVHISSCPESNWRPAHMNILPAAGLQSSRSRRLRSVRRT